MYFMFTQNVNFLGHVCILYNNFYVLFSGLIPDQIGNIGNESFFML